MASTLKFSFSLSLRDLSTKVLTRKDPTDKRSYKERKQKSIKVFERRDPIDFYGFDRLYDKNFLAKALSRWENILHTNAFIDGDYNCSFEKNFARLQGAKHCLLVGNGTDALEIALQVCGSRPRRQGRSAWHYLLCLS